MTTTMSKMKNYTMAIFACAVVLEIKSLVAQTGLELMM